MLTPHGLGKLVASTLRHPTVYAVALVQNHRIGDRQGDIQGPSLLRARRAAQAQFDPQGVVGVQQMLGFRANGRKFARRPSDLIDGGHATRLNPDQQVSGDFKSGSLVYENGSVRFVCSPAVAHPQAA